MKNDKNTFNGFAAFDDLLPGGTIDKQDNNDLNDLATGELTDEELEELRNQGNNDDANDDDDNNDNNDIDDNNDVVDDEPKDEPKKKPGRPKKSTQPQQVEPQNIVDDSTSEGELVSSFFDSLADKLGWDDITDEEKPKTAEDLIDYFADVINENSTPMYASDEMAALDEFVRNGGKLRDYIKIDAEIDLDNIEIEGNESNQRQVLREMLKEKGYSDATIQKKLTKYEDAGILEDEALDAIDTLKELKEQKKQQLLEQQKAFAEENSRRQQQYVNNVVGTLKSMDNIYGVKISDKDKARVLQFIFKPDADGRTAFQKKWSEDIKNLLQTAYFLMDGDRFTKAVEQQGSNKAVNRFKQQLNRTGVSRRTNKQDNTSSESMWDSLTQVLRAN